MHSRTPRRVCPAAWLTCAKVLTRGVVVHLTVHAVYHAGRSGGRSNFTRIEYIQGKGIVGLVAGTVSDRRTFFQTQLCGCSSIDTSLLGESRFDVGNQRGVESIIVHQKVGNPVVLEIPEHPFGQTGHRGTDGTAQLHGDIVARQHYLMNLFVNGRLILINPSQFGGREVARRIQQM